MNMKFSARVVPQSLRLRALMCVALAFAQAEKAAQTPASSTSTEQAPSAAGGIYKVGGTVVAPRVIYKKDPAYSEEARKAHLWGAVVLQLVVGADGLPRDIKVVRPLGMGLDEIAVETVGQWRFQPGTKQGNPVNVMATIEVNFRLLDLKSVWQMGRLVFEGGESSRPMLAKWHLPDAPVPERDLRLTFKVDVDKSGNVTSASPEGTPDPTLTAALQEAVLKWKFHVPDRSIAHYSATLDLIHGNPPPVRLPPSRAGEVRAEPKNAEEAYREGVRLVRDRAPEQAIAFLTRAIQEKPEWGAPYSARAQAYYNMQRYHEAVDDLTVAIRLNPNQSSLYDRRGLSYSYAGRHDIGLDDYNRAIELSANPSAQYYNNRGWAYAEMGQLDKALADLNRALEIAPDFARAFGNRGDTYMKLKDYNHAIADFTAALQLTTTRSLLERRAEAKRLSGDDAGAADELKRANDLPPAPTR